MRILSLGLGINVGRPRRRPGLLKGYSGGERGGRQLRGARYEAGGGLRATVAGE